MLKVCWAGIPLRSLIKATSGNTMPLLSPLGWSISKGAGGHKRKKESHYALFFLGVRDRIRTANVVSRSTEA